MCFTLAWPDLRHKYKGPQYYATYIVIRKRSEKLESYEVSADFLSILELKRKCDDILSYV